MNERYNYFIVSYLPDKMDFRYQEFKGGDHEMYLCESMEEGVAHIVRLTHQDKNYVHHVFTRESLFYSQEDLENDWDYGSGPYRFDNSTCFNDTSVNWPEGWRKAVAQKLKKLYAEDDNKRLSELTRQQEYKKIERQRQYEQLKQEFE